jgi:hypothetical protein
VRLHALFFVVEDGAQAEIAFAGAKGVFDFGELDIPARRRRGIAGDGGWASSQSLRGSSSVQLVRRR